MLLSGLQSKTIAIRVHQPHTYHPWRWLRRLSTRLH